MIPLGFSMQDVGDETKLVLYRAQALTGILILFLIVLSLVWKYFDTRPAPPSGLSGFHFLGMEAIHVPLYLILRALTVSGIMLNVQSGLTDCRWHCSQRPSRYF